MIDWIQASYRVFGSRMIFLLESTSKTMTFLSGSGTASSRVAVSPALSRSSLSLRYLRSPSKQSVSMAEPSI